MGWRVVLLSVLASCAKAPAPEVPEGPPAADPATVEAERLARAGEAYNSGDYATHVALLSEVIAANPDNDVARYNLACGLALSGDADGALATLEELLGRRVDFGAAADPDFRTLREDTRFQALIERFDALFPRVSTSTLVAEIDDFDLNPEGLAYDDVQQRYFVSSIRHSKVVTVDASGAVADFGQLSAGGVPVGVLGLEVDRERGVLWAVGRAQPNVEGYDDAHNGITGVFALDLATGEQREARLRPHEGPAPGFNDLTVSPEGDIYVSGGGFWRFPAAAQVPEVVPLDRTLESTNGITFGPDANTLYISTQDDVIRVDLRAGTSVALTGPDDEQIGFFDGMYYTEGQLVGIQLGTRWRAVALTLDDEGVAVVEVRTLEQSNPGLTGATTGALVGDELHYLAVRRPTDAELEGIDEYQRGTATKPMILRTRFRGEP